MAKNIENEIISFTSSGLYKLVTKKTNKETIISEPNGANIAYVSETLNNEDATNHFDLNSSFIFDDGTEVYFHKKNSLESKLEEGVYIFSNGILFHLSFNSLKDYKELKLSAPEFDNLFIEEHQNIKQYFYDSNSEEKNWTSVMTDDSLENIAYESFGSFSPTVVDFKKEEPVKVKESKKKEVEDISFEDKKETLDEDTLEIYLKLERLKASNELKSIFFEYYFEQGVDEIVLKVFTSLVEKNEEKSKFDKLDEYVKEHHSLSDSKNSKEEEKKILKFIS